MPKNAQENPGKSSQMINWLTESKIIAIKSNSIKIIWDLIYFSCKISKNDQNCTRIPKESSQIVNRPSESKLIAIKSKSIKIIWNSMKLSCKISSNDQKCTRIPQRIFSNR